MMRSAISIAGLVLALVPAARAEDLFRRGDFNGDTAFDISDPLALLLHLFGGRPRPWCLDAGDSTDDGLLDLTDAVFSLEALFLGGPAPPEPAACGSDPTADGLGCAFSGSCSIDRSEVVDIREMGSEVEIEVWSTQPFPVRALAPSLCIGEMEATSSRPPPSGDLHRLIFILTAEEFSRTRDGDPVSVQHGGCSRSLEDQRLYWDLWVLGNLEKGLVPR